MRVCVVTGTRAEYGLLKPLLEQLKSNPRFQLQLVVTGAHLSPDFGMTYKQIEAEGFCIDEKVEMLLFNDTAQGITKSMGTAMIGFSDAFEKLKPDLLVILGDRYEMLAVASTALIFKIPIAHIHGGEVTEGAYDDAVRHAITKMSHLHFASTEAYRNRIIQMGEQPETVFNVGAIGLDNIKELNLLSKDELEKELGVSFKTWNYTIGFHPETMKNEPVDSQFQKVLNALDTLDDSFFIFTKANADTGGLIINEMMQAYVAKNPDKSALFDSLGSLRYLSMVKHSTALVGNSSSGIIEASPLNTPTINIGNRQEGRIFPDSVLSCSTNSNEIAELLKRVQNKDFMLGLFKKENPYGNGETSKQIEMILSEINLLHLNIKKFYNL